MADLEKELYALIEVLTDEEVAEVLKLAQMLLDEQEQEQ